MNFTPPQVELAGIAPEIALTITAFVVLILHAFIGERWGTLYLPVLSTLGLVLAAYLAIDQAWGVTELQLAGMVAVDGFATFVKVVLAGFGAITIWLGHEYFARLRLTESEFYALVLFAVAGMMLMGAAADLIMLFLALETFSISLYVLVAFLRRSLTSQESALKYFLLGAFSSTFFLLGIALAYGAVGSTNLYGSGTGPRQGIVSFLATASATEVGLLVVAMGFLIVGLGFKVALIPFHMWTPDAYQGAPSPVTGFMAAASKIAGFAALIRLLEAALFPLRWDWQPLMIAVAVATMIGGSVLAVVQEDVKRMLAYSSIAHAGFILTGIIALNDAGVAATLLYLVTYGITVVGAFAVLSVAGGGAEERARLVDMKGLFARRPWLAGALSLFLLSLAGVPLTSGFVGKLLVFGAAIRAGFTWLVVVGMVTSAIAAFFYLRVMVVMYMQEAEAAPDIPPAPVAVGIVGLTALATVGFGLFWGPLIEVAEKATLFFPAGPVP